MERIVSVFWAMAVTMLGTESEAADAFFRRYADYVESGRRPGEAFFSVRYRRRALAGGISFPDKERELRAAGATFAKVYQTEAGSIGGKTWIVIKFAVRASPETLKAALAARGKAWYEAKAKADKATKEAEAAKEAEWMARALAAEAEREAANRRYAAEAEERRVAKEAADLTETEEQAAALRADGIEVLEVAPKKVTIKFTNPGRSAAPSALPWTFVHGRRGWYLEQANYPKVKANLLDAVNAEWTNRKR